MVQSSVWILIINWNIKNCLLTWPTRNGNYKNSPSASSGRRRRIKSLTFSSAEGLRGRRRSGRILDNFLVIKNVSIKCSKTCVSPQLGQSATSTITEWIKWREWIADRTIAVTVKKFKVRISHQKGVSCKMTQKRISLGFGYKAAVMLLLQVATLARGIKIDNQLKSSDNGKMLTQLECLNPAEGVQWAYVLLDGTLVNDTPYVCLIGGLYMNIHLRNF